FPTRRSSDLTVVKGGKQRSGMIPAQHLKAMLYSEKFLGQFPTVDLVTSEAVYLPGFELAQPGYNDRGEGARVFYVGDKPHVAQTTKLIDAFLAEMQFATNADRTN